MVSESPLESTEHGLVPKGKGWFVLNAREAPWIDRKGRGYSCEFEGFEGEADFSQLGRRFLPGARGRRQSPFDRPGLGRLHRRSSRPTPWRGCRARDDRLARGIRTIPHARTNSLPRRLDLRAPFTMKPEPPGPIMKGTLSRSYCGGC